ncbi:MAG: hypothetical protein JKX68_11260 [Flavobacteriales bacterium]|nr:hypothetical protein [Flavobacteriales bacterium]
MECLTSGNTTISLSEFKDCNKTKKEENPISQKCCDFNNITLDFDYNSKINSEKIKIFNTPLLVLDISNILLKRVFTSSNFNFYTNLPPPSGYELLKVVQVFRL